MLVELAKALIMKSKILLQLRFRILYIALALTLAILMFTNIIYGLLLPLFLVYIVKQQRDLTPYILVVISIYAISLVLFTNSTINSDGPYDVKVIKVSHIDDYYKILGRINAKLVNIYLSDTENVLIGLTYKMTGSLEEPVNNTIPNAFNYKHYLYSNNIKYTLNAESATLVQKTFSIFAISKLVEQYIETYLPESKDFIKTFLLADKSEIDQSTLTDINYLGISHMFAVSGYHIALLVVGITMILNYFKISKKTIEHILIVILALYMVITYFSASVVRASMLYICLVLNKRVKLNLSVLDILSIIYIGLLIIRPYYFYNIGFVLSFLITFILILSQQILKNVSKFHAISMVSFIAFLASFPIVLNMNYQLNLLTLIFNIVIIYIMTVVILPFAYITFIIPLFDKLYGTTNSLFIALLDILSNIELFVLKGYISTIFVIMILYIFIFFVFMNLEQRKSIYRLVIFIIFVTFLSFNLRLLDPRKQIVFLDVHGDSTLIKDSFDQCNILIDTGDVDQYDTVNKYILSKNISRIDYLIVSHFHSDHYGETQDMYQNLNIENLITKENVDNFDSSLISCGSLSFYIYDLSYKAENENNNSMVVSVFIEGKHYLFMGDSEFERETEFLDLYNIDVDYLKVGHHGSITSSSQTFLKAINPEQAFIMVHRDNRHRHPDTVVIERLLANDIVIYRTDTMGSIEVTYVFGNETKKYYRP